MATDTTVNNLIINKLTKAQYEAIASPSDTELYLVPDVIDTAPTSGSDNTVTSGGVYTALSNKADVSDIPTESTVSGWGFTKNAGTVTSVTVNGSTYSPTNGDVNLGTIGGGGGGAGNLNTTATTSQATSSSESLSGNVTLHKVSKTGAYTDLVGAPQYVICTLLDYNSMASHDANTYYLIVENNA